MKTVFSRPRSALGIIVIVLAAVPAFAQDARSALAELGRKPSTLITDRYGRPLRAYLDGSAASVCSPVRLQEVSPWLVLAAVAAEDKRFFSHPGVDFRSVARAFWQNYRSGRTVSGASTITQQLARALNPGPRTFSSKFAEFFSALRLEAGHSKEEILESYFNSISYGNLLTGAGAASEAYFGIPVKDISPAQAALLAGIPKSPVNYDPYKHPDGAFRRQRSVLHRMLDLGLLDEAGYAEALSEKIQLRKRERPFTAPQFSDYVLRRTAPGSGSIRTTLDRDIQELAAKALENHLDGLRSGNHVTNGAVLVLDNSDGGVIAWVGSNDFSDAENAGQLDGVTALRQPGSALKPFLYALALSKGARTSDILEDEPLYAAGGHTTLNYDKTFHGKVRLREALACSYNIPAVRTAEKIGVESFLAKLRDFGFASLDRSAEFYGEGLALGNGEVTLLELANAYASLARGGIWFPVRFSSDGSGARPRRAVGRKEAWLITDILSDNSARTPAFGENSAFNLPFALAGKTGTTKDYRDNWAVGYTPEWTVGVWVGNFNGSPMRKVSGITGAAPVLKEVALGMNKRYPATAFNRPIGIRMMEICPVSGLPPSPFCPAVMEEVFSAGNIPSGRCGDHTAPPEPAGRAATAAKPAIKFPKSGDIFRLDPQTPRAAQALFMKADGNNPDTTWWVDGVELSDHGESAAWPLNPGIHRVYFSYSRAGRLFRSSPVRFSVFE